MDYSELELLRQLSPEKYKEKIADYLGLKVEDIEKIETIFSLIPKDIYAPDEDAPVDTSMTEIAEKVTLPVKVVGRLQDIGAIDKPIIYKNLYFLKCFQKTWGNMFLLKTQLARYSQAQREEILTRSELATKWEKWVYSRYFKNEIRYGHNGRMISPEKRIRVEKLAEQVEDMFGVPDCYNTRERIKKIREMAYNDKKRGKDGGFWKGRF